MDKDIYLILIDYQLSGTDYTSFRLKKILSIRAIKKKLKIGKIIINANLVNK